MSKNIKDYRQYVGIEPEKFFKTTLFQGEALMLGLNCLEPGQVQAVHSHAGQDKFYFVIDGTGHFTIGDEETDVSAGNVVWAKADTPHGVENKGTERLTLLVGIAPPPASKG